MYRAHQIVTRFRTGIAREDGNVESALVIIPLMILFLIGAQIIAATNMRNADLAMAQGDAASIRASVEALNHATDAFAAARMDRNIQRALTGQNIADI